MKPVRAVLLALLTLCGMVAGVSLAAGVTTSSPTTSTAQQSAGGTDAALGNRISAFMQSNAAETSGAVESGMWATTFDNATNRSVKQRLVTGHVDALQNRLDEIRDRKQRLVERREAGEISRLKYESEMSGVIGRYNALVNAINETERRAESTGTNTSELAELRANSEKVAGSEMSAVARNLSGVDAPGLEKANRTGPGSTPGSAANGNGNGNGNANNASVPGNGKAKGNVNGNASVNGNGSASINASAAVNATTNATNVTDGVGTVTGTLDGTNRTDPANLTAPGRSNGQGPPDRTERGNGLTNPDNASDGGREPATEEPTRVVTSGAVTTDAEPADVSTTGNGSTTGVDGSAILDATDDGAAANGTVGTTAGFAL